MRRLLLVSCVLLVGLLPAWSEGATEEADARTLNGMHRTEILSKLGKPNKTKTGSDGSETLIFKLLRLDADTDPSIVPLLLVPDVGWVGRKEKLPAKDELSYEPSTTDRDGRPVPGGISNARSGEVSWSPKDGVEKQAWPADEPRTRPAQKIKLTLHLDSSGNVDDWSVSPKKPVP